MEWSASSEKLLTISWWSQSKQLIFPNRN
jgi:hypothetical protein